MADRTKKYQVLISTSVIGILLSSSVLNGMLSTLTDNPFKDSISLIRIASATSGEEGGGGDQGGDGDGGGTDEGDQGGGDQDNTQDQNDDQGEDSDTQDDNEAPDEDNTETDTALEVPLQGTDGIGTPSLTPEVTDTPESTTTPTPVPTPTLRGLVQQEFDCFNGIDEDGDGRTDRDDGECGSPCPPGSPPTCIVFTGPPQSPSPSPSPSTTVPYCGGETLPPGCDGKRTPTMTPSPSPEATPGPAPTSRLDPYAECILFPFSLKCQNGVPTDTNLPALTPPDPTTCNLDKNYPGCPGADIFKFNQESIACESAATPKS